MRKRRLLSAATSLALLAQAPESPPEGPLIRVTVNLVQVDAVVTDRAGRIVTDLTAEDFEVLQDGKTQKITRFSYISTQSGLVRNAPRPPKSNSPATPVLPVSVSPEQVRRTIVVVVDDLALSYASMYYVRESIKQLANSLQPGDLVSIIRSGAGSGALQSFTTDRQQLILQAEAMRWNPRSRTGLHSIPAINDSSLEEGEEATQEEKWDEQERQFLNGAAGLGTFGTLTWVMSGLREMPGRKSILLLSEGFQVQPAAQQSASNAGADLMSPLQRLTEAATRAGVVIYTVDPRGLETLEPTAADKLKPARMARQLDERRQNFFDSQASLRLIAEATGGRAFLNSNDLGDSYRKVLDDQSGFYLLGYDPGDSTFNRKFHKIAVRVKRKGLQVRSRSGFFGIEDRPVAAPRVLTKEQQLVQALKSPFHASSIPVKLTGLFIVDEKKNPGLHTLLHVGLETVQFKPAEDGFQHASLNVLVAGFDAEGATTNHTYDTFQLKIENAKLNEARKKGMMLTVRYPVQRAGAYQLRAAVRDEASSEAGTASQFLAAPDTTAGKRLALSSLVLGEMPKDGKEATDRMTLATRQFAPGSDLAYSIQIFNPKILETGSGNLTTQLRIFENGKQVYEGKAAPLAPKPPRLADTTFTASGRVHLGPNMKAGDYALQLTVTDLGHRKPVRQTQWTDFHVVR
ncbi:MAG: VWA domain-containing protein [Acidobacteria bacterium]|nr:VWA domain-containing protein [Acidobacteriota bacterium]